MSKGLSKKYGLLTAIAMVAGVVIGSGIFFKTEVVLGATGGNAMIGIAALLFVGIVMIICAYTFSILAGRHDRVGGLVDYAEAEVGSGYAYCVGWFSTVVYFPTVASVVLWLAGVYTCQLFGIPDPQTGGGCLVITGLYLILIVALNGLAPILSGKLQISATVIKLIPLVLMAVVGIIGGVANGTLTENFASAGTMADGDMAKLLLTACVAMAFSYEGWIVATTINSELRDAKRTLPRALILGSLVVVAVYVLYYLGITGSITIPELMEYGSARAFENIFGGVMGRVLLAFVVVSCLGTCNGLIAAGSRGMYALAARNEGPAPELFVQVDSRTGMPHNSVMFGAVMVAFWVFFYYGGPLSGWFGPLSFDSSELPIVTLYAGYIPIFVMMMKKEKDLHPAKRYVMPVLAILGCLFIVGAAISSHGVDVLWYLLVFAVIMAIGLLLKGKREE